MEKINLKQPNYIIRGGNSGRNRLDVLHRLMAPATSAFIDRCGIAPGQHGLDLGCGAGTVTVELAGIVGNTGSVTGIDMEAGNISSAKQRAASLGLNRAKFRRADVMEWTGLPGFYDFAYARFLLTHLPDPAALIRKIYSALQPGGSILLEDIDFTGHFSYPDCPAFDAYVSLYTRAVQQRGADPNIGPRLPVMVKQAGFRNLQLKVVQPTFQSGEGKQMASLTLENIADSLIRNQLATPEMITRYLTELRAFEQNENTLISLPRIFQVWACK